MKKPWSNRHLRHMHNTNRYKAKLERYNRDLTGYPTPVYIKERDNKSFLKRLYRSRRAGSRTAWYLKCCNQRVRHYKGDIISGGYYRKLADYWWLIY